MIIIPENVKNDHHLPVVGGQEPSGEEYYFLRWCKQLMEEGFIEKLEYKEKIWEISVGVNFRWQHQLKTKVNDKYRFMLDKATYQPDFTIYFTKKADGILVNNPKFKYRENPYTKLYFYDPIAYVDVKGSFDKYGASQKKMFELQRKLIWKMYAAFVHRIEVPKIFNQTFTPERYLWTDGKTKLRTLHYDPVSINTFISEMIKWKIKNVVE